MIANPRMSFSSNELWQKISAAGLASPMQCRGWAAEAAKGMDVADATDGLRMLQQLIEIGKLTKYQAKILAGQSDKPLNRGPWFILQEVKNPLFSGWLEVTKVDTTKAEKPPAVWAKWLRLNDLQSLKQSSPSLPRGIQLAGVEAPYLQPVLIPELQEQELQIQVGPVAGKLLIEGLDGSTSQGPKRIQMIQVIVDQVASALAALHQSGLHHGRVTPDRIFWSEEGATLARDPIAVLTSDLDPSVTGLLDDRLNPLTNAHFLAPEFIAPGQPPSITSDVFSLGCTWWWLLTGKPPATGKTAQEVLASQAQKLPALPSDVELPEPMKRVLGHCLARNHTARFQSSMELLDALRSAHAAVQKGICKQTRVIATPAETPADVQTSIAAQDAPQTQPLAAAVNAGKKKQPVATKSPKKTIVKAEVAASRAEAGAPKKTELSAAAKSKPKTDKQDAAKAKKKPQEITSKSKSEPGESDKTESSPAPRVAPASQASAIAESPSPKGLEPSDQTELASPLAASIGPTTARSKAEPIPEKETQDAPSGQNDLAAIAQTAGRPTSVAGAASGRRRKRRKKQNNKWMVPVFGGLGFLVVVLLILQLSGALQPGGDDPEGTEVAVRPMPGIPSTGRAEQITKDPLEEFYRVVSDSSSGVWAPPQVPAPIPFTMLPPGGGMFLAFSPSQLLTKPEAKQLLVTFESEWTPLLTSISTQAGVPIDQIKHCTMAFYPPELSGGMPFAVYKFELASPTPLSELKAKWGANAKKKTDGHELLMAPQFAYYVPEQPLVDAQSVNVFSVGPASLMEEVAELEGAAGPLLSPVEKLWKSTSNGYDFTVLADAPFLFTEGRGMWSALPTRLRGIANDLFADDTKSILFQTQVDESWYFELQVMGESEQDAGRALANIEDTLRGAPQNIEQWFVTNLPHPHWRFLALKFPLMLRSLNDQSRFGVERGVAVVNGYMPLVAATNITLTSWKSLQEGAVMTGGDAAIAANTPAAVKQMSADDFLNRAIKLSFDQEPFEEAFDMIAEEANDRLPAGVTPLRFALDGDAFEAEGITRNLELREFSVVDQPVKTALTALCVKGNPVPGADIKSDEQKVVWILKDDDTTSGAKMVVLTTRKQAAKENASLPADFVP